MPPNNPARSIIGTLDLYYLYSNVRETLFEKLAINFLALMKLAIIQRSLRIVFSNRA